MKVAVVGHVECAQFAIVERVPEAGEIVPATDLLEEPAGGGAVAAVQLAKLNGSCLFLTATGNDPVADSIEPGLRKFGVEVVAIRRDLPQRRAFVFLDRSGERTITTLGDRLSPLGHDDLPWQRLAGCDAVYVTATDAAGVKAASTAHRVVATVRAAEAIWQAEQAVDVVVASSNDLGERFDPNRFRSLPGAVVRTDGSRGGTITYASGEVETWNPFALNSPPVDSYGAGDSFAAGLTYGLGLGLPLGKAASIGALCGAANVQGRGPYSGQATAADLERLEESGL